MFRRWTPLKYSVKIHSGLDTEGNRMIDKDILIKTQQHRIEELEKEVAMLRTNLRDAGRRSMEDILEESRASLAEAEEAALHALTGCW